MNLQECYTELGGNYHDVVGRLFNEAMVKRFVLKFLDDQSFSNLSQAMDSGNHAQAFIASHTIKGICQNLSFTRLYESSH